MRYESEKSLRSLTKLNDSEFKFVKMLTWQKGSNDKRNIGYNPKHNYKSQTTFVKSAYKHRRMPTCSYCYKEGHLKFACPHKCKDNYINKNTFPYELRE